MNNKIKIIITFIFGILVFCGCSGDNQEVSCTDICEACKLVTMEGTFDTIHFYGEEIYDDSFGNLYGVQYDMIDDGAICYTENGGLADEISILHMKDGSDIKIARTKMEDRIAERRNTFAGYKPEEVSKLDNAKVVVQGNYIALIISNENEVIETEIRRVVSEGVVEND